jgi:hypothetical protein
MDLLQLQAAEGANLNALMYGFVSEYMEFSWDPDNSSKEIQIS